MALKTRPMAALVTVRTISPTEAPDPAQAAQVEQLAQAIVAFGASVRPLFLCPAGFDPDTCAMRYEVAGDHLSYWAACRAREIDPIAHEMTTAWILETPDQLAAAQAQVA